MIFHLHTRFYILQHCTRVMTSLLNPWLAVYIPTFAISSCWLLYETPGCRVAVRKLPTDAQTRLLTAPRANTELKSHQFPKPASKLSSRKWTDLYLEDKFQITNNCNVKIGFDNTLNVILIIDTYSTD